MNRHFFPKEGMISGIDHHLTFIIFCYVSVRVHYMVCWHETFLTDCPFLQTLLSGDTRIPVAFLQLWVQCKRLWHVSFGQRVFLFLAQILNACNVAAAPVQIKDFFVRLSKHPSLRPRSLSNTVDNCFLYLAFIECLDIVLSSEGV